MKIGYARVSTTNQNLDSQILALKQEGCKKIYYEKVSSVKEERTEFKKLLKELKEGDTLVVTKLDRFARSTTEGINVVKELFERGVKVHVLNLGLVEDTPTGRLILSIMLAFAEFERDLIYERTQEGKAIAQLNPNWREGRPNVYGEKQKRHAVKLLETHTYREVEELTGMSKSTLIRAKKKYGKEECMLSI